MPRHPKEENPVYGHILISILNQKDTLQTIKEELTVKKYKISTQELRNKLSWLNSKSIIGSTRNKHGAIYSLDYNGIIPYIFELFFVTNKRSEITNLLLKNITKNEEQHLIEYLKQFLIEYEKTIKILNVQLNNKKDLSDKIHTLKHIFESFIIEIAMQGLIFTFIDTKTQQFLLFDKIKEKSIKDYITLLKKDKQYNDYNNLPEFFREHSHIYLISKLDLFNQEAVFPIIFLSLFQNRKKITYPSLNVRP